MKGLDFCRIDVESDHVETRPMEGRQDGQADVAQSNDADVGGSVVDFARQVHFVGNVSEKRIG
jgi:hypothetical protein